MRLQANVYKMMIATAKAYPQLKNSGQCPEITKAVENALSAMKEDAERQVIEKNLFECVPLHEIDIPYSERTMRRIRKRFANKLSVYLR